MGHLPTWGVHLSVSYLFCLFIVFMVFSRREYWRGLPFSSPLDHVLSELSTMTHPSWVAYTAWLIVLLSSTRLWSMWSVWLVFCDCGFHSVCPLMEKDNRLMEASWWERLTVGETGSWFWWAEPCSVNFNPVFCWWAGLCFFLVVWPEIKLWRK